MAETEPLQSGERLWWQRYFVPIVLATALALVASALAFGPSIGVIGRTFFRPVGFWILIGAFVVRVSTDISYAIVRLWTRQPVPRPVEFSSFEGKLRVVLLLWQLASMVGIAALAAILVLAILIDTALLETFLQPVVLLLVGSTFVAMVGGAIGDMLGLISAASRRLYSWTG